MNQKSKPKGVLPPAVLLGAICLAVGLHLVLPLKQVVLFPYRLLALVPLLLGVALNLLADGVFKKAGTTVKPFEVSAVLITDGVFRLSRNPMYLGMVLIVLGIALGLGSLSSLLVAVALPAVLDRAFIVPEERMLEETFGEEFASYRRRVRRWV